ncbi:PREDICTED: uncharacterized protein LOC109580615 isoform X2 [Amphimedon queenslandica]|uniref:Schlafen AlbA-2 domain-containing protein n=1 Tax=Amphimedon queenslandica TaxID=400682 RepID=A0A1X7VDB2_AMPQE|nr:PREDICTED: uncharacterized protein LOC109580615 isoform X2 [Amphimedon queenslandica]|eukprot:XP_019849549.1 PREDICTED: uncharacterized protein LOC109580615 isoform X2 [Amphimedon queenslandica]
MPLTRVGKRSRKELTEENNEEGSKKKQKRGLSRVLVLYEFDRMDYQSDKWHTLIRTIPEDIVEFAKITSRIVCSFLNGSGGILCFGCRSNGRIYGEKINRKEEDNIRLLIDDTMKRFHPFISPSHYRINFITVKSRYNTSSAPNCVLEIKVEKGDPHELYETEYHEVFLRTDEGEPYGPLSPHEIKRHVLQQYRKKLESKSNLCNMLKDKKKAIAHVRPSRRDTTTSAPVNKTVSVPHPLTISQKAVLPKPSTDHKDGVESTSLQSTKDSLGMDNEAKDSLGMDNGAKGSLGMDNEAKGSLGMDNEAKDSNGLNNKTKTASAKDTLKDKDSRGIISKTSHGLVTNQKATNKSRPNKGQPSTYAKKSHCPPFILPPPPPPPFACHNNGPFHYPGYQPHFIPPAQGYSAGYRNHGHCYNHHYNHYHH